MKRHATRIISLHRRQLRARTWSTATMATGVCAPTHAVCVATSVPHWDLDQQIRSANGKQKQVDANKVLNLSMQSNLVYNTCFITYRREGPAGWVRAPAVTSAGCQRTRFEGMMSLSQRESIIRVCNTESCCVYQRRLAWCASQALGTKTRAATSTPGPQHWLLRKRY